MLDIGCITCHHYSAISLRENWWRPFHMYHKSLVSFLAVNGLLPMFFSFFPSLSLLSARSKIQYAVCFTSPLHTLFIFKYTTSDLYVSHRLFTLIADRSGFKTHESNPLWRERRLGRRIEALKEHKLLRTLVWIFLFFDGFKVGFHAWIWMSFFPLQPFPQVIDGRAENCVIRNVFFIFYWCNKFALNLENYLTNGDVPKKNRAINQLCLCILRLKKWKKIWLIHSHYCFNFLSWIFNLKSNCVIINGNN